MCVRRSALPSRARDLLLLRSKRVASQNVFALLKGDVHFFFRSRRPVWMENKYLLAILLSMLLVSGPEAKSLDHMMIPFDFLGPVFQFLHVLPSTCFFGSFDDSFLLPVSAKCVLLFIMPYGFFRFLVISVSP